MTKSKPSQEERNKRRQSHAGWLIQALTVERCCSITPQPFTAAKLLERGYPQRYTWPVFEDFDGARMLIEMVMSRNIEGIRKLKMLHPLVDFGLDDWMAAIEKEQELAANITRKPIKTPANRVLFKDYRLEHFIQVDSNEKTESIVAVILRGRQEVAIKTLASRTIPT